MFIFYFLQSGGAENKWGEVARLRLQYDEARKQVSELQNRLVNIEDQIKPGQNESDKDRYVEILVAGVKCRGN